MRYMRFMLAFYGAVVALTLLMVAVTVPGTVGAASPALTRARLHSLVSMIERVADADALHFGTRDSAGHSMDAAKILQDRSGEYLAVYHTRLGDGRFHASLATSKDLIHWTYQHDFGAGTSQPTMVQTPDGGFLLAWEKDPSNHIALRYYSGMGELLAGVAERSFDAARTASACSEGTPSIQSVRFAPDVDHSTVVVAGHYRQRCSVDRQLRGTLTDFATWRTARQPRVDKAIRDEGVAGNIGDRDPVPYQGHSYEVIEGQYTRGDFGSWGTFVRDPVTGAAERARIRTWGGSASFANPNVTVLNAPNGRRTLVVSVFLPREGAAPGEAGQLLYFRSF